MLIYALHLGGINPAGAIICTAAAQVVGNQTVISFNVLFIYVNSVILVILVLES